MQDSYKQSTAPIARRALFKQAAAASSIPWLGLSTPALAAPAGEKKVKMSPNSVRSSISLEQFLMISRYLTARDQLDSEMAKSILRSLNTEAIHQQNLPVLFQTIKTQLQAQDEAATREFLISHNQLAVTAKQILIAWFTGVRVKAGKPELYSYFDAQMWNALQGIRNIPASCGGAFGFWSEAPVLPS